MTETLETPVQKRIREDKNMTFSERYEEELKQQLFEEDNTNANKDKVEEVLVEKCNIHKARPNQKWDVPIDEEILYFDPELSYEITGYRPINMEKGLDFDPNLFRPAAEVFERTGKYTEFPKLSKPYRNFWDEEYRRCKNGYTVGKYTITGDHYFFINYYRMDVVVEGAISGSGRKEAFPIFLSKQYEWFHYVAMAEKLHKDVVALKSRGVNILPSRLVIIG